MDVFACTWDDFAARFAQRQLLHGAVDQWAARQPQQIAILNATRGTSMTYAELRNRSLAAARALLRLGFRKGDFFATSLPLTDDHIVLEYACFRAGVIHVPLDLRLSRDELVRSLRLAGARGYATALPHAVAGDVPTLEHVFDAGTLHEFLAKAPEAPADTPLPEIQPGDGAQVIFTTGSTGSPKAALLTHRGIAVQNYTLGTAFEFEASRVMVHLPPSHVGCQAELLMTTLFWGGTAVTLEIFDPGKTLEAIEKYRVRLLGQIPAMFLMEWRHSEYPQRDLSSLEIAVYGGQSVPRPFLEKLRTMAPRIGTGLGLTEASGFCTYTPVTGDVDAVAAGLGHAAPIYPMSIREPMREDGRAGAELPEGRIGHVCFRGPQTFAGYVNDDEATRRTISTDGWLYTGDMGFADARGLHFNGRAKWVIKPAGYQVFPGDVEEHIAALSDKVAACGVVGVPHPIWVEAIVAFVEKKPGVDLTEAELRRHARALTSYKRPLHYVILEPGQMPLNRVAKVDTLRLKELAEAEVERLKQRGRWATEAVED
ncbi:MAG: long-chain-fatty-acid--CoA ligase [Bryobacteraceae bacterium]|nr:MAG: long-chain-fatty-acid--CoA ligase [Bryobacteraceae bacterium]